MGIFRRKYKTVAEDSIGHPASRSERIEYAISRTIFKDINCDTRYDDSRRAFVDDDFDTVVASREQVFSDWRSLEHWCRCGLSGHAWLGHDFTIGEVPENINRLHVMQILEESL